MTGKTKSKTLSRQQELMRGFHFNQAALEANRRGEITEQQRKWVLKRERWYQGILLFLLGLGVNILLIAAIVAVIALGIRERIPIGEMLLLFCFASPIVLILAVVLPATYGVYSGQYQIYRDLKAAEVLAIRGLTIVNLNEKSSSSLIVNKLQLKAPRGGLLRVKHLEPHIVYYLPHSKVVVSVEVVEES